ncbi:MAG: PIN domain-containing protein [Verrucomicrobiota bacterium]
MNDSSAVHISRAVFLTLCVLMGIFIAYGMAVNVALGGLVGGAFAGLLVLVDASIKNLTFRGFSHATFGLMVGVLCAWVVTRVDLFSVSTFAESGPEAKALYELAVYLALAFLGLTLAVRSNREEFSIIIPYVRFRRDSIQDQPILVDTNVVIDGRIPRICETGFLSGHIIIPRFVLDELHVLSDSPSPLKQERGRTGLDSLKEMQQSKHLSVTIHEERMDREALVDTKLIQLARQLGARILTNDANLGQVAALQGVAVLNLHELSDALRPVVSAGDTLDLTLVKKGKDEHQGVGYLSDGTMIVVNRAADRIGDQVQVVVSSALQTSAGRLIFAELGENAKASSAA